MTQTDSDPKFGGGLVPARPHDSGSQANETLDAPDTTAEALRHAAEDTPSGALRMTSKEPRFLAGPI